MEFQISHKRKLKDIEKDILNFLFEKEKKEWIHIIEHLKVIARCGCGNCPIVFFGNNFDDEVSEGELLIDYFLNSEEQGIVGISVFGNKSFPTQLEIYSIDGLKEITKIPSNFKEAKKVKN